MTTKTLRALALSLLTGLTSNIWAQENTLVSAGSSTLSPLLSAWKDDYQKLTGTQFKVTSDGSNSAIDALLASEANFGAMSRTMSHQELRLFDKADLQRPIRIRVALDTMAIVVNKDNPVAGINEYQIDAIFSKDRNCGASNQISNWQRLGGNQAPISAYGHDSQSGSHGFFKKWTLCDGAYGEQVITIADSRTLIERIATDPNAITYAGFNKLTDQVKALPVARGASDKFAEPTDKNALLGQYPLRRFLSLYLIPNVDGSFKPDEEAFIRYILSDQGQALVDPAGFTALSEKITDRELDRLTP